MGSLPFCFVAVAGWIGQIGGTAAGAGRGRGRGDDVDGYTEHGSLQESGDDRESESGGEVLTVQ